MKESIWFYLELVGFSMFQIYYFISKKISLEFCFEQIHEFAPLVLKSSSMLDKGNDSARVISLKQPVDQVPYEETGEFADEKENYGPDWTCLVEAEGYCDDISYERDPCRESEPDAVPVDLLFLLPKGLRLDLEPLLNPFPSADPSYPVSEHAPEPVAEGSHDETSHRIGGGRQNRQIKGVRAEREYSRSQESPYEETEKTESFKPLHSYFLLFLKNSVTRPPHSSASTP